MPVTIKIFYKNKYILKHLLRTGAFLYPFLGGKQKWNLFLKSKQIKDVNSDINIELNIELNMDKASSNLSKALQFRTISYTDPNEFDYNEFLKFHKFTDEEINYLEKEVFGFNITDYGDITAGELLLGKDGGIQIEVDNIENAEEFKDEMAWSCRFMHTSNFAELEVCIFLQ